MKVSSGKFIVRVPPELHASLREEAERRGLSLNRLCVERLQGNLVSAPPAFVVDIRNAFPELCGIVLFGSVARGEATGASDVDLLLVLLPGTPISRSLYRRWTDRIEPSQQRSPVLSPQFVSLPAGWEEAGGIWFEVAMEGRVLFERDRVITDALIHLRTAIAEGLVARRYSHGQPYWLKRNHEK